MLMPVMFVFTGAHALVWVPGLRHQHEARLPSSHHRRRPILRLEEDNLSLRLT